MVKDLLHHPKGFVEVHKRIRGTQPSLLLLVGLRWFTCMEWLWQITGLPPRVAWVIIVLIVIRATASHSPMQPLLLVWLTLLNHARAVAAQAWPAGNPMLKTKT